MAVADHWNRVPKMRAHIVEVDPDNNTIDLIGGDGQPRRITVWEVPTSFRWPLVGEDWSLYEQNGSWYLGDRAHNPQDPFPITLLGPGEQRLDGVRIFDNVGRRVPAINPTEINDGQAVVYDSNTDRFIGETPFAGVPIVTSLPIDPVGTPEVDLVADDTGTYGGPYLYRCKYRAASAGIYKWHVIGAAPYLEVASLLNHGGFSNSAYASVPNFAAGSTLPSLTIPFAGDWDITVFSQEYYVNSAGVTYDRLSYSVGATAAQDIDGIVMWTPGGDRLQALEFTRRKTGIAAGTVLQMQAKVVAGVLYPNNNTANRPIGLRAKPVRIG